MRAPIASFLLLSLTCCLPGGSRVQTSTVIEHDAQEGITRWRGPTIRAGDRSWFLRALDTGDGSAPKVQLHFHGSFLTRANLDHAYSNGVLYEATVLERDASKCYRRACVVAETVAVHLTLDDLQSFERRGGLAMKIAGSGDSAIVEVPADYVTEFLNKIEGRV